MSENVYCRLCALKIEQYVGIYEEEGEKLNLATKIIQCLQIWLYPEDILPKTVCTSCCSKVDHFFEFFHLCSQSQISLMSMMKERESEEKLPMIEIGQEDINSDNNITHGYEENVSEHNAGENNEYTSLEVLEKSASGLETHNQEMGLNLHSSEIDVENQLSEPEQTTLLVVAKRPRRSKSTKVKENISEDEGDPKLFEKGQEGCTWKCTDCPQEFSILAEVRRHYAEDHNRPPVFACMYCSKSYTRYRSFSRHMKLHSEPKKYKCGICGKGFAQKTVLQAHATVHSDERPHACSTCGKRFKQFSSLYLHNKCHLPGRSRFTCTECSKQFASKKSLETHLKLHTGERNFVCDVCGKRFIAKGSLDYHISTHNEDKPYSCSVCGKGFKTSRQLEKHSTLHTGVKPYQCDVCGKQFRERGALKEHIRIHTGVMPYSCEYCGRAFRFKGILTVHLRQHTGERPYSCVECKRDFTNWANYNKHMKRRHRDSQEAQSGLSTPPEEPSAAATTTSPLLHTLLHNSHAHYETVVEEDVYPAPSYVPAMAYYMAPLPLQHPGMPTRSQ